MAEATPDAPTPTALVTDALRRHRRPVAAGLALCTAALLVALTIPVGLPDAGGQGGGGPLGGEVVTVAPAEDLSAFVSTDRWGGLTYEELEARRRAAEAGADAEAARRDRMGFVGTTSTPDDQVVLLTLPSGEIARVPAGGELPDGRTVSDVTDTTATLSDSGSDDEELELFPRPPTQDEGTAGSAPQR